MSDVILELERVNKIHRRPSLLSPDVRTVHAVRDVTFTVERGEVLGIVGESGSGKSTLARAILHLDPPTSGTVRFEGTNVSSLKRRDLLTFRDRVQIVFQDPNGALDPRQRVGQSVEEGMVAQGVPRAERRERAAELFSLVGLPPDRMGAYPHEFSGGQKQRIVIARALAVEPGLLILDEPVSSLDVSIQAQIINLLSDIRARLNLTYVFISHDLNLVSYVSDRVGVMRRGEVLELAPTAALLESPRHEYTKALFASAFRYDDRRSIPRTLSGRTT